MKINIYQGDQTDNSAKEKPLLTMRNRSQCALSHSASIPKLNKILIGYFDSKNIILCNKNNWSLLGYLQSFSFPTYISFWKTLTIFSLL